MTDRYAVIGNPVEHSKSPQIHAAFAKAAGADMDYSRLPAPLDAFAETVAAFRKQGGKGLNVTLPFKLEALALATAASERARRAGAANFLRFEGTDIVADNTDGAGLVRDITQNLGFDLADARVLLVGAGGAARGVIEPLLQAMPALLAVVNRTAEKARELALQFALPTNREVLSGGGYASIAGERFDVIINATSASIAGATPLLPDNIFAQGSLAYDLMYGDANTPFLAFAKQHGAALSVDGLGMLVEQAAESFFLWRGVRPQTAPVLEMLRSHA
jgi:shikimate dehydrogenase